MSVFYTELQKYNSKNQNPKHWFYIPYDQLSDDMGPLSRIAPQDVGIILIESTYKASRRPYHKQKLAYVLCNGRHFALEQAKRGVHVKHIVTDKSFGMALRECGIPKITMMRPAERELRADLSTLVQDNRIHVIPHEGWLTQKEDLTVSVSPHPPWRMDRFYQNLRKKTRILMDESGSKPMGGKYSFDAENRQPWNGTPSAPTFPTFDVDPIKAEVAELISSVFSHHPGNLDISTVPATKKEVFELWNWICQNCLEHFGTYEDAMSTKSSSLFHTRISPLLNIHRITPQQILDDVVKLDIPLNSKEGFVRQILGWREFMYQIHEVTDGFRKIPHREGTEHIDIYSEVQPLIPNWTPVSQQKSDSKYIDGGSCINKLSYKTPLPEAFWTGNSGMFCLDHVVQQVMREGYTHHIPRLMVLANIATLLEITPREITDWFWVSFVDAYDWVVEPNVLAMGTFATDEILSTKPYVAGSGYIQTMSDYCKQCAFHPKKTCPLPRLYWAYLERHQERFQNNFRMKMVLSTLKKRSTEKKIEDQSYFTITTQTLSQGKSIHPSNFS